MNRERLRELAKGLGLLNGDPDHDDAVLDRLWWHFTIGAA